jgi:hypothetical protein
VPQSLSHRQGPIPRRTVTRIIRDRKSSGGILVAEGEVVVGVDPVSGQAAVQPLWTLIDWVG